MSTLAVACATPPQIVEISPERNATQVPSNANVVIGFDRPVDRASVAAHFSISPAVSGSVTWASPQRLVFTHAPLRAATTYSVRLSPGYRDASGHANQLAHGWRFTTEPPPTLTGSSPGPREQNVDPAGYVTLQFSRQMDVRSLQGAVSISPSLPVTVRADPADARRVIVAPQALLEANATYSLTITPDARDADGNPLDSGVSLDFATGSQRPLSHWVTFLADRGSAPAGIWLVDENRIPRQVASLPADSYSWSPDGAHLLTRSPSGTWSDVAVGGSRVLLPFQASWAGALAAPLGYAYLDAGRLWTRAPSGTTTLVDSGVTEVAVSPDGRRLAYVAGPRGAHGQGGTEIRGYTVELRSHYRIAVESDAVDGLDWSPDAGHLAFRTATADAVLSHIRVKDLLGTGTTVTVAIGEAGPPRWLADSRHLVLSATVTVDRSPRSLPFRLAAADLATRPLTAAQAIATPPGLAGIRDPMPSPDGHQLAFLESAEGGDQVWVMNVDGTGYGPLTAYDADSFPYSCRAPAWTRA